MVITARMQMQRRPFERRALTGSWIEDGGSICFTSKAYTKSRVDEKSKGTNGFLSLTRLNAAHLFIRLLHPSFYFVFFSSESTTENRGSPLSCFFASSAPLPSSFPQFLNNDPQLFGYFIFLSLDGAILKQQKIAQAYSRQLQSSSTLQVPSDGDLTRSDWAERKSTKQLQNK